MTKTAMMKMGTDFISILLNVVRPDKDIRIEYVRTTEENIKDFSDWDVERFGILTGEELILIFDKTENHLLYVVNVTGDSVLTAMSELMNLIAKKF